MEDIPLLKRKNEMKESPHRCCRIEILPLLIAFLFPVAASFDYSTEMDEPSEEKTMLFLTLHLIT